MENNKYNLGIWTYGSTPAAKRLVTIMNQEFGDNRGVISKVSRTLNGFNRVLNELKKVDTSVRYGIAKTLYIHYRMDINNLPQEIRTYVDNVLCGSYKNWFNSTKGYMPLKNRKKLE